MKWTKEMDDYLREVTPGHTMAEIGEMMKERFGVEPTRSAISNRKSKLGVKSGIKGGQFLKGSTPVNKGKTWDEMGYSEEAKAAARKTQFKKGSIPVQGRAIPLGTERVAKDGYIEVKTQERSTSPCRNNCWSPKATVMWEKYHGCKLPEGYIVMFANHDIYDFSRDNLVAVEKRLSPVLNRQANQYHDKDSLLLCVDLAKLASVRYERKKDPRQCTACGVTFKPDYPHQARCRTCIDNKVPGKRKRKHE